MRLLAAALCFACCGCDRVHALFGPRPRPVVERAEVTNGPWLLNPGAAEATVAWTTERPSKGRVWYLEDHLAQEDAPRMDHRVTLQPLPADSEVRYRIEASPAMRWRLASIKPASARNSRNTFSLATCAAAFP